MQTAQFWRYGNIDFFFHEDRLTQIFTDDIDSLDGGENTDIEKWILNEPKTLSVDFVIQSLIRESINFLVRHHQGDHACQTSIGLINSCVHLNFQPVERDVVDLDEWYRSGIKLVDPNAYELCSITLMDRDEFEVAYNTKL